MSVCGEVFDLGGGVAAGGDVELIGLGEELDGAGEWGLQCALEGADDIERGEEFVAAGGGGFELRALGLGLVLVDAVEVVVGDDGCVEKGLLREDVNESPRLLDRGRDDGYFGKLLADGFALDGVVVDEDEGVEAEGEFFSEFADGLGFLVPVDFEGDEVVESQRKVG